MKQLFTFALLLTLLFSCQQQTPNPDAEAAAKPAFDEASETAAIMQVIDSETKCFFDGNYECWAKNWSHQPYAFQAWNNSDGTADAAVGWEKINSQGKGWIEDIYKKGQNVVHPVFKRDKPQAKFFGDNMAYLIWTQYNADKEKKYYRVSRETRLMEKESDGWKIVNVSAFWGAEPQIAFDSLQIN